MKLDKNTKVAEWYDATYGEDTKFNDDMAKYIDDQVTFQHVIDCIENDPGKYYSLLGVSDSVVMERVFKGCAEILKVPYQRVYDRWLDNDNPSLFESRLVESDAGLKSKIEKVIRAALESEDHEGTWYVDLDYPGKNRWAVAIAWMDWDNTDDWELYGKVAYQSRNSVMQSDYDMDWLMPQDPDSGDVIDTEMVITSPAAAGDLIKSWEFVKSYLDEGILESKAVFEQVPLQVVMLYLYEGKSLTDAIRLAEDTITPDTVYRLKQTPGYKEIQDDVAHFFKICDDVVDYKKTIFKDDPIAAFNDEADFCEDVADFLGSINLKGFGPEFTKPFMQDTAKMVDHLDHSATELRKLLKKQDRSTYIDDTGKPKPRTNQRPGEYAKRALKALGEFFAKFGVEFDYDPGFNYKSVMPDANYEIISDLEDLQVKLDRVSGENKSFAKELLGKVKEMLATVQSGGKVGKRDINALNKQVNAIAENKILKESQHGDVSQTVDVEIEVYFPDGTDIESGLEKVSDDVTSFLEDADVDVYDVDIDADNCTINIDGKQTGTYEFTPGVMYTPNGDGYPDDFETDLSSEDWLEDKIYDILHKVDCDDYSVMVKCGDYDYS